MGPMQAVRGTMLTLQAVLLNYRYHRKNALWRWEGSWSPSWSDDRRAPFTGIATRHGLMDNGLFAVERASKGPLAPGPSLFVLAANA